MEIGKRLKQARLEAGLSQRQLSGDVITRNMLSLIENGSARPSMDTLAYLAGRLGKPVGYFLEDNAVLSANQQVMDAARKAFGAGQHERVLEEMKAYRGPDDVFDWEADLLLACSNMELACQAISQGRLPYGASLLEQAGIAGEKTPYFGQALRAEWQLLQARLQPERASGICVDEQLMLKAEAVIDAEAQRAAQLLDAMDEKDFPRWCLLRGKAELAVGEYAASAQLLHRAEAEFPEETAPLLEACYREMGDFRKAYEYACRQRG